MKTAAKKQPTETVSPTSAIANKKPAEGGFEILMVAGAGFEPTTFGL